MHKIRKKLADKKYKNELEQATIRLISCAILVIYTLVCAVFDLAPWHVVYMYIIAIPYCMALIAWIIISPGTNHDALSEYYPMFRPHPMPWPYPDQRYFHCSLYISGQTLVMVSATEINTFS